MPDERPRRSGPPSASARPRRPVNEGTVPKPTRARPPAPPARSPRPSPSVRPSANLTPEEEHVLDVLAPAADLLTRRAPLEDSAESDDFDDRQTLEERRASATPEATTPIRRLPTREDLEARRPSAASSHRGVSLGSVSLGETPVAAAVPPARDSRTAQDPSTPRAPRSPSDPRNPRDVRARDPRDPRARDPRTPGGGRPLAARLLPRSRWGALALAGIVLGLVFLGLGLRNREPAAPEGVSVRAGSRAALVAAGAGDEVSDSPLQSSNYVSSLAELHAKFGEPPGATLGRMRIPSLKIDAPLSTRPVPEGGQMPNPYGPDDIAYYDFSAMRGYGGFPGAGGNAVFAGHVDEAAHLDYAGLDYLGPGVFFNLRNIDRGDVIEIDVGNGPVRYKVRWVREVELEGGDWRNILGSDVSVDSITLITCGGTFSTASRSYTSRTVVRAERA